MATRFGNLYKTDLASQVLTLACAAAFLGRAWHHIRWDPPYREFLWSEETMEPLVTGLLRIPWETYVSDPGIEQFIQGSIRAIGLFLFPAACATLLSSKLPRAISKISLIFGIAVSVCLALCYYRESSYRAGELLEFFSQIGVPLLLLLSLGSHVSSANALWIARIATSATFLGHAAYSTGFYPVPRTFTTMVMNIFRWDEPAALEFLRIAGWIDIAIAILVLLPRVAGGALIYAALWGSLTALARITAYYSAADPLQSISQWGFETLVRVPNAAMPLVAWLLLRQTRVTRNPQASATPPALSLFIQPNQIPHS